MRRIGIDVGGTNTDAVLVDGNTILGSFKTPTTPDVTTGIIDALSGVLARTKAHPASFKAVMIGTTHFTNAVAQRRFLTRVAAIRICLPASRSLEPFIDWPADLREKVLGEIVLLEGGHECDGRPIVPFDEEGMRKAARKIREKGLTSVGITSVFSPLTSEFEERAAEILRQEHPQAAVTLSHTLGRIGLLERENATLLNASLKDLAGKTSRAFIDAIRQSGLEAQLYLTQNDGTVMLAEMAERFPIFSFASGPTNSMRGGAFLSGLSDAVVVDVGGTTTDVGMLVKGFPREANNVVEIGGVRTLFRMPDVISLALGGGTLVGRDPLSIGPESTGYELMRRGLVFGGDELTCTDLAVSAGLIELGERARVSDLPKTLVTAAIGQVHRMIEDVIDRIKTEAADVPVIAVGGGAFLVPERMKGVSRVMKLPHGDVANAVGAAIAQVSGECDQIFHSMSREEIIASARAIASRRAVEAGADPDTLEVVDVEDLPLAYMPGNSVRARVRVVGEIA
ncbi:MAG TPA: hydantoinase/oxoprolinase family protein [Alphaproteobacteria bacterium]|nr:hydantoinase/oxoprolinase family protein [Alphaproteobacteria bacterium]